MVCPSCKKVVDSPTRCPCGARWVGLPTTEPIHPIPRMGYGLTAATLISLALTVQLAITFRNLYLTDLQWEWALYLMTEYMARFIVPVAVIAAYLAWRGLRGATRQPSQYGGRRLCRFALASALAVCFIDGGVFFARLPATLENRRLKHQAYTHAMMYKLNNAIVKYREQYGSYPERLIDLQELDPTMRPVLDFWDHQLIYRPMSPEVASRVMPVPFLNYLLISRGPDGVLGTGDDIVMRDGLMAPLSLENAQEGKSADLIEP